MMNWAELQQLEWSHPWWALLALQPLLIALLPGPRQLREAGRLVLR